ncbi:MAG: DUF3046 domain-containing protein [Candidatus Nanopelagicales bacterium]
MVEGPEEGSQRLAVPGGGDDEGVAALTDGCPGTLLRRCRSLERRGEPGCGRRGEVGHLPILASGAPGGERRGMGETGPVRLTDFWERMDAVFGPAYAKSWARDYSLSPLDGRTVMEAIDAGLETREIWEAVCQVVEVPSLIR